LDKLTERKNRTKHLLKSLFVFFFVVLSTFGILTFFEKSYIEVVSNNLVLHEANILQMQNDNILYELDEVVSDLSFLEEVYGQALITNQAYEKIQNDWLVFSNQKKHYDQIRYIDKDGNEILVINNSGENAVITSQESLQNKQDRNYFTETMKLAKGQIYISEIDLNLENDTIAYPYTPTIRFSMPIYDEYQQNQG